MKAISLVLTLFSMTVKDNYIVTATLIALGAAVFVLDQVREHKRKELVKGATFTSSNKWFT